MINISIIEFTRRLIKGGSISLKGLFLLPAYYFQIIPALLFSFLQFLFYGRQIKKTQISKDTVFINGHNRKGTT
jgi:hypothetical protein